MVDIPERCVACDTAPATTLIFCTPCFCRLSADPDFCLACVRAHMRHQWFCEACQEQVSQQITEDLRAYVQETDGPCITCCEARPSYEGLFCAACYAEQLIDT
jgi:hypothetical protein